MKVKIQELGLLMFFSKWQVAVIECLLDAKDPKSVSEITKTLNKKKSIKISKSSVLEFAETLVEEGLAKITEIIGRGGKRKMYQLMYDEFCLKTFLVRKVVDKLVLEWDVSTKAAISKALI